jgi:hypothetical protein
MPPGRLEAMYTLRPPGDWIGQPSTNAVFSSELLPAIVSIFWPVLQGVNCAAKAAPATVAQSAATTPTVATALDRPLLVIVPPFARLWRRSSEHLAVARKRLEARQRRHEPRAPVV